MYPNFLNNESISSYTVMIIFGVIGCILVYLYQAKRNKLEKQTKENILIVGIVSGCMMYVGAFLFDAIFHSIKEGKLTYGSITFLGGMVTAVITFYLVIKHLLPYHKRNILFFINIVIPGVVLAHSLGRIGCFLVGCCYGKETTSNFGVTFKPGSDAYFVLGPNHNVLPTQLYEAIFLFILFIVLIIVNRKQFIIYLFSYGIFRFILEFFRGDDRGSFILITPSQFLSICLIILGIYLLIKKPDDTYHPVVETEKL